MKKKKRNYKKRGKILFNLLKINNVINFYLWKKFYLFYGIMSKQLLLRKEKRYGFFKKLMLIKENYFIVVFRIYYLL
jgi:hypothetical protein